MKKETRKTSNRIKKKKNHFKETMTSCLQRIIMTDLSIKGIKRHKLRG